MIDNIFIHVGYPKTGTTWLQGYIFPRHSGIRYWNNPHWVSEFLFTHDLVFDAAYFRSKLNDRHNESSNPTVMSNESFIGSPFAGAQDSCRNANRLHAAFPNAKIIICVRNQIHIIESLYKQYIQEGGTCSFEKFLSLRYYINFSLDYVRYDRIVAYYQKLFGSKEVYVCIYEHLKEAPQDFLDALFSFLNVNTFIVDEAVLNQRPNRGMSPLSLAIMRFMNHFISSPSRPCGILPGKITLPGRLGKPSFRGILQVYADPKLFNKIPFRKSYISEDRKKYFREYFRESNQILNKKFQLSLEKYDYPL